MSDEMNSKQTESKKLTGTQSNGSVVVELFRYPILVASILIAALILNKAGVDFSLNFKEGALEVKKQSENVAKEIQTVSDTANQLQNRLAILEAAVKPKDENVLNEINENIAATEYQASDDLALLSRPIGRKDETIYSGLDAWIFLGTSVTGDNLKPSKIQNVNGVQIDKISSLTKGDQFAVSGNMVLRKTMPNNDVGSFKAVESVGVLPRNSKVVLLDLPAKRRASEWWAHVKVSQ